MAYAVNEGLVAFVRLTEGGVAQLNAGDTVPAEADQDHVARLVEKGVLTETKEPKAQPAGNAGGSSS